MLNITLREEKRNDWIRNQTKVYDISISVILKKLTWAGHFVRKTMVTYTKPKTKEERRKQKAKRKGREIRSSLLILDLKDG